MVVSISVVTTAIIFYFSQHLSVTLKFEIKFLSGFHVFMIINFSSQRGLHLISWTDGYVDAVHSQVTNLPGHKE